MRRSAAASRRDARLGSLLQLVAADELLVVHRWTRKDGQQQAGDRTLHLNVLSGP